MNITILLPLVFILSLQNNLTESQTMLLANLSASTGMNYSDMMTLFQQNITTTINQTINLTFEIPENQTINLVASEYSNLTYMIEQVNASVNLEIWKMLDAYRQNTSGFAENLTKIYQDQTDAQFQRVREDYVTKNELDKISPKIEASLNNQTQYLMSENDKRLRNDLGGAVNNVLFISVFLIGGAMFGFFTLLKRKKLDKYMNLPDIPFQQHEMEDLVMQDAIMKNIQNVKETKKELFRMKLPKDVKKRCYDMINSGRIFSKQDLHDQLTIIKEEIELEKSSNSQIQGYATSKTANKGRR